MLLHHSNFQHSWDNKTLSDLGLSNSKLAVMGVGDSSLPATAKLVNLV